MAESPGEEKGEPSVKTQRARGQGLGGDGAEPAPGRGFQETPFSSAVFSTVAKGGRLSWIFVFSHGISQKCTFVVRRVCKKKKTIGFLTCSFVISEGQNLGYAAGDGFSNDRKPAKDRICTMQQVRLLLWVSPHSFWASVPVSWFLPVPPGSLCFVFFCGCCSESEDSLNLS